MSNADNATGLRAMYLKLQKLDDEGKEMGPKFSIPIRKFTLNKPKDKK